MDFEYKGESHTIEVVSDDEFVTVVSINGIQIECDRKMIIDYRDPDGNLTYRGLRNIAISIFSELDKLTDV